MSLPFSEYYKDHNHYQQMARRMDRKVIKLEAAYGSERQFIVVKRNQDLIAKDIMEEVNRVFKIPMEEQVIFHKGSNICDFPNELIETLGIENNHPVRVCRDTELSKRSPRSKQRLNGNGTPYGDPQNNPRALSPVSYLKEIAPHRVPDPTPHQVQIYNQAVYNPGTAQDNHPRDVLKLYVTYGSDREYILVHGRKPLMLYDLKMELNRIFKIPNDKQCIVFKGYYLHEYLDDAPLDAFGMENNNPISVWYKAENDNHTEFRHPRPQSPGDQQYSPRGMPSQRWGFSDKPTEVLKIDVCHGSDRHQLILKGQNKNITVEDLMQELEKVTAVPIKEQRLFFKAQELHLIPNKTLKECDIENNTSVKMVGDPSKMRYQNYFGRMPPKQEY